MCHLKLEMLLQQTGYKPKDENRPKRLNVFLTNSLEESHPDTGTLFASWLSKEATEANYVKRDTPVMCVIGNPPYANFGQMNQGEWIKNLIADFKKDLNEKKINLDDDYIKFIRFGQYYIEKNGEGILAYISNNSFIDGITHRQMRKVLMNTFTNIYIIDLHGNSLKKEISPDGSLDQNVFDIRQGVSINIFVKTNSTNKCRVAHTELWGERSEKYEVLLKSSLNSLSFNKINPSEPYYFFTNKQLSDDNSYHNGFSTSELFLEFGSGVQSDRDPLFVDFEKEPLQDRIKLLLSKNYNEKFIEEYNVKDSSSYNLLSRIDSSKYQKDKITNINYRPFDVRAIYYDENLISRPGYKTNKHLLKDNIGLVLKRGFDEPNSSPCFIVNSISDRRGWSRPGMQGAESIIPIYLYNFDDAFTSKLYRKPNLNNGIIENISKNVNLTFTEDEPTDKENTFSVYNLIDYIYAVLNSPEYYLKYFEYIKIDFPKVPFPKKSTFKRLVKLGSELRTIHLFESDVLNNFIASYPVDGTNSVDKIGFSNNRVMINADQYFDKVPEIAWNFYIGGYQPAQKWLKDRKGRTLTTDEIMHYQKIIVALTETDKIMKKIDEVGVE